MKYFLIILNTKVAFLFLILFSMVSLQGCMQYYKVKKVNNVTTQEFESAKQVMIPLSEIAFTDVYNEAQGRSTFSWITPGLVGAGLVLTGFVIVARAFIGNSIIE